MTRRQIALHSLGSLKPSSQATSLRWKGHVTSTCLWRHVWNCCRWAYDWKTPRTQSFSENSCSWHRSCLSSCCCYYCHCCCYYYYCCCYCCWPLIWCWWLCSTKPSQMKGRPAGHSRLFSKSGVNNHWTENVNWMQTRYQCNNCNNDKSLSPISQVRSNKFEFPDKF